MGLAMMLSLMPMNAKSVQAATLPADVSKPSSGCVFIAMEGHSKNNSKDRSKVSIIQCDGVRQMRPFVFWKSSKMCYD